MLRNNFVRRYSASFSKLYSWCKPPIHTVRTLFLAPHVGDFLARQISVFTGSLLILVVVYLFVPWIHVEKKQHRLRALKFHGSPHFRF